MFNFLTEIKIEVNIIKKVCVQYKKTLCVSYSTLFLPNSCHPPIKCKRAKIIMHSSIYIINTQDQILVIELECPVQL